MLIVCVCAVKQVFSHSSSVISTRRSSLQALSLECEVSMDLDLSIVYNNAICLRLFPLFTVILSVSERGGSSKLWVCDVIKLFNCKYLK